jgi:predicted AAA+ superfamily ATPase
MWLIMDSDYITRLIYEYNPHISGKAPEVPEYIRSIYSELESWLDKKQIMAIVGLRRTGKTTIMRQIMANLGNDAAFFSFDEEESQEKEVLVYVIDFLLNNFQSKYIFLDEVHYVKDWQGVLKRFYDTKSVKFVISGSESLELKRAKESLAGRIVTFTLTPLSFFEFIEMKGRTLDIPDFKGFSATKMKKIYTKFITEKEFFESMFLDYLYKGAFPEMIDEKDDKIIRKYVSEIVVNKILFRDIPNIFNIRRKKLLSEIMRYVSSNSSNLFEIKNLCNIFNADYETVSNYLFYLQSSFLIKISENYSGSMAKRMRRNKKIYVVHPAIAFGILGYSREMLIDRIVGPYVETVFAGELFWRDKNKNEVDVVINDKKLIPIEVKFRSVINPADLKGLVRFMDEFDLKQGYVITKNKFGEEKVGNKKLIYVPAWLFLLIKKE